MPSLFLPALRGVLGDWVYYSCLFQLRLLAEKVSYSDELHESKQLSDMIQRELSGERTRDIAEYLKTKERFFSSLVVAVYGGDPQWIEIGKLKPPKKADFNESDIPETVRHSIGFLRLTGEERLFAIDGQHRLSGIKAAIPGDEALGEEEVSVLLVAHKNTKPGMQRTRRLFTTLNKTAVEVSKGEIIALDEDDTMAICARKFYEESGLFKNSRLSNNATNNLPTGDDRSLTTIGNLYDVLSVLFEKCKGELSYEDLRFSRPDDDVVESHFDYAVDYFELLKKNNPILKSYFGAANPSTVVKRNRGEFGGNVLLRPIGLLLVTEVVAALCMHYPLKDSVAFAACLPQKLEEPPFADIIWDTRGRKIINSGRALARKILLYLLGDERGAGKTGDMYAQRTGASQPGLHLLKPLRCADLPLSDEALRSL